MAKEQIESGARNAVNPEVIEAAVNHFCDICDAEFFGTEDAARANGWEMFPAYEFCGHHGAI